MAIKEQFSSRWGIILASLGMAIGAGNLWRFPRLAGQYGGSFLILWIVFLLIWSIPILMAEFAIGKKIKQGVINSFTGVAGKRFAFMGFFIALCTLGITFYYSVVTAWGLQYLGLSLKLAFSGTDLQATMASNPNYMTEFWATVHSKNYMTVLLHIAAVALGILVLVKGIQKGLERANRILIPSLFVLLIIISIMALSMPGGVQGLEYMFSINPAHFSNATVWLEALSQSAWSTGAGWGLIMTLASYSRKKEDVTLNIFVGSFGNNTASLVSGMAILPAVFALAPSAEAATKFLQAGNQGLTFTIIPQLFAELPGGVWLSVIFFLAFFLAAFSSLLPMIELFIKVLGDLGLNRLQATVRAAIGCVLIGFPSAIYLDFFNNQDWVWGLGLIISGLFIIFAAMRYGMGRFKRELIDADSDFLVPNAYFKGALILNIALGVVLLVWWMSQGYDQYPWFNASGRWNLISIYSNATIVTQWGLILLAGILLNKWLVKQYSKQL